MSTTELLPPQYAPEPTGPAPQAAPRPDPPPDGLCDDNDPDKCEPDVVTGG